MFVGFGTNAIVRLDYGLTFFEFELPAVHHFTAWSRLDSLVAIHDIRDIFMRLIIHASTYYGTGHQARP